MMSDPDFSEHIAARCDAHGDYSRPKSEGEQPPCPSCGAAPVTTRPVWRASVTRAAPGIALEICRRENPDREPTREELAKALDDVMSSYRDAYRLAAAMQREPVREELRDLSGWAEGPIGGEE